MQACNRHSYTRHSVRCSNLKHLCCNSQHFFFSKQITVSILHTLSKYLRDKQHCLCSAAMTLLVPLGCFANVYHGAVSDHAQCPSSKQPSSSSLWHFSQPPLPPAPQQSPTAKNDWQPQDRRQGLLQTYHLRCTFALSGAGGCISLFFSSPLIKLGKRHIFLTLCWNVHSLLIWHWAERVSTESIFNKCKQLNYEWQKISLNS